ncbi:MAG: hypothetical protein U0P45_15380 [Acidimicrobiales bacterium]
MIVPRKVAALGLAGVLVLVGTGCGKAAEKVQEKALEKSTGAKDVDINKDGDVTVKDKDGNTFQVGNADLPSDWPEDLKPPSSVKLAGAQTSTTNGKKSLIVSGETSDSFDDIYRGIKSQLEAAGYEITNDTNTSGASGNGAIISATGSDWNAQITIGETDGKTSIFYALTQPDA